MAIGDRWGSEPFPASKVGKWQKKFEKTLLYKLHLATPI